MIVAIDVLCALVGGVAGFALGLLLAGVAPWLVGGWYRSPKPLAAPVATPRVVVELEAYRAEVDLMAHGGNPGSSLAALLTARVQLRLQGVVKQP